MVEIGYIDEKKFEKLNELIRKYGLKPSRILIVGKNLCLKIGRGDHEIKYFSEDYSMITPRRFNRGQILDSFSKIEYFIEELIVIKMFEASYDNNVKNAEILLDKLDFYSKFKLLSHELGLIDKSSKLYSKILLIKAVRDSMAHLWNIEKVYYENPNKGLLKDNFEEFKEDLKFVWKGLIEIYETMVDQNKIIDEAISTTIALSESRSERYFPDQKGDL